MDEQEKHDAEVIGHRIEVLRASLRLTQTQFAERVGSNQRVISEWESGRRMIMLRSLLKISRAFSINLDYFHPDKKATVEIACKE